MVHGVARAEELDEFGDEFSVAKYPPVGRRLVPNHLIKAAESVNGLLDIRERDVRVGPPVPLQVEFVGVKPRHRAHLRGEPHGEWALPALLRERVPRNTLHFFGDHESDVEGVGRQRDDLQSNGHDI